MPRPTLLRHKGQDYYAFRAKELDRLMEELSNAAYYKLRLKRVESLLKTYEGIDKQHTTILAIADKRYEHYKRSYALVDSEWLAVNREKNKYKYKRKWAKLWKPLGFGTFLIIAGAVAISNK